MRALLLCATDLSPDQLQEGITRCGWWSQLPQDSDEIQRRKAEVLARVPQAYRELVAQTYWYTIYNDETKTWGIVNSPTSGRIAIRLVNDNTATLKKACEILVRGLQETVGEPDREGVDHLDFLPEVTIMAPDNAVATYRGEILSEARLRALLRERRIEYRTASYALGLALFIFVVTTPPLEAPLLAYNDKWARWFFGILERTGTAAITTFTLFCFDIASRLRALQEKMVIRWL